MSTQAPLAVLAIDPGATSGVALVLHTWKGRPTLVGAWAPFGRSWALRLSRYQATLCEVQARVAKLRREHVDLVVEGCIELPPKSSRQSAGKLAGVRGQSAWRGIGEAMGAWRMAAHLGMGLDLSGIPVGWARDVGDIPVGKDAARAGIDPVDGWHRVAEAEFYLEGAREALGLLRPKGTQAECKRTVDAAEASLIGVAHILRRSLPPAARGRAGTVRMGRGGPPGGRHGRRARR